MERNKMELEQLFNDSPIEKEMDWIDIVIIR